MENRLNKKLKLYGLKIEDLSTAELNLLKQKIKEEENTIEVLNTIADRKEKINREKIANNRKKYAFLRKMGINVDDGLWWIILQIVFYIIVFVIACIIVGFILNLGGMGILLVIWGVGYVGRELINGGK